LETNLTGLKEDQWT